MLTERKAIKFHGPQDCRMTVEALEPLQEGEVLDALRRCQPDTLTPIEAMSLLYELKQKLS